MCEPSAAGGWGGARPRQNLYTPGYPPTRHYFLLPTAQDLAISGGGAESVKPWGFGFRAVGSEMFSKTGGLQFQSVKVDSPSTGRNTFYLWDLLLGKVGYIFEGFWTTKEKSG